MARAKKSEIVVTIPKGQEARILHTIERELALIDNDLSVQTWEFLLPRDKREKEAAIPDGAAITLKVK